MGSGSYVLAEENATKVNFSRYQTALAKAQTDLFAKCDHDWKRTYGGLTPPAGSYGATTIMPELFDDYLGAQLVQWRQNILLTGEQMVISGTRANHTLPEDWKVAWVGIALPNKHINISELRWQIGDRKFGRVNIEEMLGYPTPAVIFEQGFIIDEEESFELWANVENAGYQRIVLLGEAAFRQTQNALGNTGAAI